MGQKGEELRSHENWLHLVERLCNFYSKFSTARRIIHGTFAEVRGKAIRIEQTISRIKNSKAPHCSTYRGYSKVLLKPIVPLTTYTGIVHLFPQVPTPRNRKRQQAHAASALSVSGRSLISFILFCCPPKDLGAEYEITT